MQKENVYFILRNNYFAKTTHNPQRDTIIISNRIFEFRAKILGFKIWILRQNLNFPPKVLLLNEPCNKAQAIFFCSLYELVFWK